MRGRATYGLLALEGPGLVVASADPDVGEHGELVSAHVFRRVRFAVDLELLAPVVAAAVRLDADASGVLDVQRAGTVCLRMLARDLTITVVVAGLRERSAEELDALVAPVLALVTAADDALARAA